MKSNGESIKIIEENDLCISCGACTHICPFDNILMNYNTYRGKYDAVVQEEELCLQCNGFKNCLAVCPSYNVNYEELASSSDNGYLGKIHNVYNGYAQDEEKRVKASSGGFIRQLSQTLLQNKEIDGIISITHDKGLDYTPKIITDVENMPNSIYHNIDYENAINLLNENKGKYLLVGLPCQITSIEQLSNKKKYLHLKERIYAKVALICGYTFDRTNMEFFSSMNAFKMDSISYRESGRYRKTRLRSDEKSILFDVYNPKTIAERINNSLMFDKLLPQKHCLYCVDHLGYCADIVVGDAWQKKYIKDKKGTNIIIARTDKGDKVIKSVNKFVFEEGSQDDIFQSQHQYATPFMALSVAKANVFDDTFVTEHIVTKTEKIRHTKLSFLNKVKIKYIKVLLRKRQFRLARVVYIMIESRVLIKILIKSILGKKI